MTDSPTHRLRTLLAKLGRVVASQLNARGPHNAGGLPPCVPIYLFDFFLKIKKRLPTPLIFATIKGMFSGSATVPEGLSVEAKGQLDATRKVITAALLKRSQGLQVLRDLSFQACLANLRGDLPGPQYMTFLTITLPRLTASLITTELLGSMTADGKSLPKDVIEAIVKYQIVGLAQP